MAGACVPEAAGTPSNPQSTRERQTVVVQQAAPEQTQPPQNLAGELRELAALRDQGILTDAEFEQQKARLLGG